MGDENFGHILQGRGESSALLIAFIIGIFGVLTLYTQGYIVMFSPAWLVLSAVYAVFFCLTVLAFKNWVWHLYYLEFYKNSPDEKTKHNEILGKINGVREKDWVTRHFVLPDYSIGGTAKLTSEVKILIGLWFVLGILLWIVVAFHCGIGDPLNPICSFENKGR